MLLAFSLSATGALTVDTIAALRRAELALASEGLGLRWDDVAPGWVSGAFVRGYVRPGSRTHALLTIHKLRQLSREFPGVAVLLSGWGDLPPTTIRGGAFELFTEAYDEALAGVTPRRRRAG